MLNETIIKGLSDNEQKAYELLLKVDSKTFLGHCIHQWIERGTAAAVRDAIQQIKSQALDSEERMIECIGYETYQALVEC